MTTGPGVLAQLMAEVPQMIFRKPALPKNAREINARRGRGPWEVDEVSGLLTVLGVEKND